MLKVRMRSFIGEIELDKLQIIRLDCLYHSSKTMFETEVYSRPSLHCNPSNQWLVTFD